MNTIAKTGPEAAVQTSPIHPAADTIIYSAPTGTNDQAITAEDQLGAASPQPLPDETAETSTTVQEIDQEVVTRIRQRVDLAVASHFYMSNAKRIATLEAALVIPVSDDKSFQQFHSHAEKDLLANAYRDARKNGATPEEVTTAQVMAEAQKRYSAKHGKPAVVNEEYATM